MKKGFTLLELIVVIAIMFMLAFMAVPIYSNVRSSTQLNTVSGQIIQDLRLTTEKSISGLNALASGIKFATSSYTMYQGVSYAVRNTTYDAVVNLETALTISTTLTGNEINFSKGFGIPTTVGAVTVTHSITGSRGLTINSVGAIN